MLLVTGLGVTRRDDLDRVHELIGCSGGTLLGAVLDSGRRRPGPLSLLRRHARRTARTPVTQLVELPVKDDTLTASRG